MAPGDTEGRALLLSVYVLDLRAIFGLACCVTYRPGRLDRIQCNHCAWMGSSITALFHARSDVPRRRVQGHHILQSPKPHPQESQRFRVSLAVHSLSSPAVRQPRPNRDRPGRSLGIQVRTFHRMKNMSERDPMARQRKDRNAIDKSAHPGHHKINSIFAIAAYSHESAASIHRVSLF